MPYKRPSNGTDKAIQARAEWDKANMIVIGCKLRRDIGDRFKEVCKQQGIAPNQVLREYIERYIAENSY